MLLLHPLCLACFTSVSELRICWEAIHVCLSNSNCDKHGHLGSVPLIETNQSLP